PVQASDGVSPFQTHVAEFSRAQLGILGCRSCGDAVGLDGVSSGSEEQVRTKLRPRAVVLSACETQVDKCVDAVRKISFSRRVDAPNNLRALARSQKTD